MSEADAPVESVEISNELQSRTGTAQERKLPSRPPSLQSSRTVSPGVTPEAITPCSIAISHGDILEHNSCNSDCSHD